MIVAILSCVLAAFILALIEFLEHPNGKILWSVILICIALALYFGRMVVGLTS